MWTNLLKKRICLLTLLDKTRIMLLIMNELTFALTALFTTGMAFIVWMVAMVMCGCYKKAAPIVVRRQK
jgi:hypothetical protein